MGNSRFSALLDEYGDSHHDPVNKAFHWVCIPAIYFSIVGLIMSIPTPWDKSWWLNFASIALLAALIYYFRFTILVGLFFALFDVLVLMGNWYILKSLGWNNGNLALISLIIFVVAWIGQFIGHKIEGKKPSFFKDLQFLLIGPAWLANHLFPALSR